MGRHDDNNAERYTIDIPADHTVHCSYDQLNYLVSSDREVNLMYLRQAELHLEQLRLVRGYVFLNEAFGYLHIPINAVGQVCGWISEPVSLGIDYETAEEYKDDPEIGLTIVHEGFILDRLPS